MQRDHARLHRSLAVLGPPRRFQLMLLMLSGVERSVSQLARAVRLSQSCTTRHLQALERAGLVKGTRDGKRVVFRPAPRDATARAVLDSLARNAEAELLHASIAAGAIPVASTAELEPIPADESPAVRVGRAVRRARARPAARQWSAIATVEAEVPRAEAAARRADAAAPRPQAAEVGHRGEATDPPSIDHDVLVTTEPALEPDAPHAEPESGNTSDAYAPPRRFTSDIEDFLL